MGWNALSADGKVLVTGCRDKNAYVWDIHAILIDASLEDLLFIPHVPTQKSLKDTDATRRPPVEYHQVFSTTPNPPQHVVSISSFLRTILAFITHPPSAIPRAILEHLSSFFHHSHSDVDGATELQQHPRRSIFSRGLRIVEVAAVQDRKALYVAPRPRPQQQRQLHAQGSSSQSQPTTTPAQGTRTAAPGAATAQSPPIPLWARFVLSICCASPRTSMVIDTGAAHVQSSYSSRLPLFQQSCFLIGTLV
ncbi:uncharacterized protein F5891DRAFT_1281489 [Suillus fuscotomentosus]|uniref:Uncharacterized protein n=1 Tax=Suillus fuscotomentosus TaxID=1912939 RepID=A0AAD4DVA7_9AGAM|nr:uncharacterized protein F5891DRAFT_1281489 [Suillus fuscotomentosus]KAG1894653.1 hypothetical protein F5891DRAFT_1281489 [Suillus fuscotomentosus]